MVTLEDYQTSITPTWCPGCGNYGIWMALKSALVKLQLMNHNTVLVYGVGCHGNMRDWMHVYGVEGLHGRALPIAQGIKIANSGVNVIVISGDGDCLGEGGNHFIHAAKRNPNITLIVHDNQVYGLTTGQASPTAKIGMQTKSTPEGVLEPPMNPLLMSLIAGSTFVSRGFAGNIPHLTEIMVKAISHKGFSVVDVLQPCVTFDKIHTYDWFRKRVYTLDSTPTVLQESIIKTLEWGDKIPTGIFWEEQKETLEDRENLVHTPLVQFPLGIPDRNALIQMFQ
jgi:2-oxoglutarate ferredoxin oxidoreductase subunit beta